MALLWATATMRCSCVSRSRFQKPRENQCQAANSARAISVGQPSASIRFFSIFTWFIVVLCKGLRKSLVDKCPGNTNTKMYLCSYFSNHFLQAKSCDHKKGTLDRLLSVCRENWSEAGVRWEKPVIKRERLRTSWKAVNIIKTWIGECQMD